MATREGLLAPEQERELDPIIKSMPDDWVVEFLPTGTAGGLKVTVQRPGVRPLFDTFSPRGYAPTIDRPSAAAQFLMDVRDGRLK